MITTYAHLGTAQRLRRSCDRRGDDRGRKNPHESEPLCVYKSSERKFFFVCVFRVNTARTKKKGNAAAGAATVPV